MKTTLRLSTNGIHEISVMTEAGENPDEMFAIGAELLERLKEKFPKADPITPQVSQVSETPICGVHQIGMVKIPAGTSRSTGRPYPAFWTCPRKEADGRNCSFRPPKGN